LQIYICGDILRRVAVRWRVELSREVADWYRGLRGVDLAKVDAVFEGVAQFGNTIRMPLSRSLGEGLYELRFGCEGVDRRITYTFELDRRVVTLTTFRKQRQNERAEILRARRARTNLAAATSREGDDG